MPDKKNFWLASLVMVLVVVELVISQQDAFYLSMFWMLNTIGWTTFYWHWKHIPYG
jgi:hypothetical protein